MRVRRWSAPWLAVALLSAWSGLAAQEAAPSVTWTLSDTLPADEVGKAAASDQTHALRYGLLGAGGGFFMGYGLYAGRGSEGDLTAIAVAGAVVFVGTLVWASQGEAELPGDVQELIANEPQAFREAFTRGYLEETRRGRKAGAGWGGLVGLVAGALAYVALASGI